MTQLPTKEIVDSFTEFLCDNSMWEEWKKWISERGYQLEEFGMDDD